MSQVSRVDYEMRRAIPATLEAVEEFLADFRRQDQGQLNRVDGFAAELLVREALTNAIVHGSHTDPGQEVRCLVRIKRGRLLIAVDDSGAGFDWRATRSNAAGLSDCSGRGIEILRKYANRVRYNDRGNRVTIIKRLVLEEVHP